MINNRQQAGRRRGRGGQGQGQRPQGNPGRPDNGNRIDNRARGNANQLHEKYQALARDAQMAGDRVNTEYYLQFADHYFRVLSEQRGRFEEQRRPRDDGDAAGDEDYGDEGEQVRGEQARGGEGRGDQVRGDQGRGGDHRRDGRRDEFQREGGQREGGQREGGQRRDGQRAERRDPQQNEPNRDGAGQESAHSAADANGSAAMPPVAPVDVAPAQPIGDAEPAPRRRGRPRREAAPVTPPADDAEEPVALDVDRLPPALGAASAEPAGDGEEKPRRRRGRPPASEAPAAG